MARYRRRFKRRRFGRRRFGGYRRRFGGRVRYSRGRRMLKRRIRRVRKFLRTAVKRRYYIARGPIPTPKRIYTKVSQSFAAYYDYKNPGVGSGFQIRLYPQDPSRMFEVISGSGGLTIDPNQLYYCYNYPQTYMPVLSNTVPSGYGQFEYSKCKIKFTLQNYCGGSSAGTDSAYNQDSTMVGITAGLQYFNSDSGSVGFIYPTDNQWRRGLNMKTKNVPQGITNPYLIGGLTTPNMLTIPSKTIKWTLTPQRIENISKQQYKIDWADTATDLSTTAGTPSTISKQHYIDAFAFLTWWKQAQNSRMTCRLYISMTMYGHFSKPKAEKLV